MRKIFSKKTIVAHFLFVAVLLSAFFAIEVSAANYTEGYYNYSVSGGEATIVSADIALSGDITIPATLGGYPVKEIAASAFSYCSNITGVTIPDGVTYVGARSFYNCSKLAEITIPPSLKCFGSEAFLGCYKLKTINISDLKSWVESEFILIGNNGGSNPLGYAGTLYLNGVPVSGPLVIPDGTEKIGNYVFFCYDKITSVTIPSSVKTIGKDAFVNCSGISSVYISDLKAWCEYDFVDQSESPLYHGGDLYLNGTLVSGELVIPGGTKSIGAGAFYRNEAITSVKIPDSVISIGQYAFVGCPLEKIDLGSGIQSIGDCGFGYSYSGAEVNIHSIKMWCENSYSEPSKLLLNGSEITGELEIPNGTTSINDYAFKDCDKITKVVIPESVESIGRSAFSSCYELSNVEIYGTPSIADCAFGWTSLFEDGKIVFYNEPKSIKDSEYTIDEDLEIYCYAENATVRGYAEKYGRTVHFLPCKEGCSYGNIVDDRYLKSEGSCTSKDVYYQACATCLNASDNLVFQGDYRHNYVQKPDVGFLAAAATCTDSALYYTSCNCGAKHPTETFTYGEALGHSYDSLCDGICNRCGFNREAPHNIDTNYNNDDSHHWYPCRSCEQLFSYLPHSYDDNSDTACNDCGYERVVLNVFYDANGGENAPLTSYIPLGSAATVSSDAPTKEGFVFVGWATDANGTVEYQSGDSLNLTESVTLYAVWKAECKQCAGTGQTYTTRSCTSCKSGYVYSSSCYYCYGRGKYSTGDMSCSNCYGSGQVKDPYGSGKYVSCLMCGGDGLVPDYQTCYYCRSKCTICNGSTKITDYFDCENCDALGYYDSFDVHYDANGGSGAPATQAMGGKSDKLSAEIPIREGFVFVGWNTLLDNNAIYQPGDVYREGEVTFYAMWAPACDSCGGEGNFTAGNTCGSCNGNGSYNVTVKTCNSCGGNHVITHVTGYGAISYCNNCGSTSIKTSTQTKTCYNCTNGVITSTRECEDCEGRGYLQTYPKVLSFSDSKVVLLQIDGMEYSLDGINWQDSNIFTDLLPGTGYSFYQRIKATDNIPFGPASAPLLLRTDKSDNEETPPIPVATEVTAESIRVEQLDGCEYSIDGVNWQSEPLFSGLDCATNYTIYARFAETDTHYASEAISYTVVRTEKGTVSAPSKPTLVTVGGDRVVVEKLEGYEYSIDGIHWQSSNAFLGLESKTNYFIYCRLAETDKYYASPSSEALTVKTLAESEIGPTYQITFRDEYGNILSQDYYELYDEITVPSTFKEPDLTYTYTFIQWDKTISEFCMGEAVYTAFYDKEFVNYEIVFKNCDGTVISSKSYHYGESVTAPANPQKAADNTYTYTFAGWDKDVVNCAGDATYTATYAQAYVDYTVIFKNDDGTVLSTKTYHYGDTVIAPATPTKAADNTYIYTFRAWDKPIENCAGNATYTAIYDSAYVEYTVTFKNDNGAVLSTKTYHYGDTVIAPAAPAKAADNTYIYTFRAWDKSVVNCAGNATYTATYSSTYIDYEIVFKNYDGSVISTAIYHYGDTVTVPEAPTKPADESYTYGFAGWDSELTVCLGNKTYTAQFNPTNLKYTVEFKDYNGNIISSATYSFGEEVIIPDAPARDADSTYIYTFAGWDSDVVACNGNKTYTATYNAEYIDYTIVFKDYDGNVISSEEYHYSDTVAVPEAPTRDADNTYTYAFAGWDKTVTACDGSAVYTATYSSTYIDYEIVFKNYDGSVISTAIYHYGDTVTVPETPTKPADESYTYGFAGWDSELTVCFGNKTYTAQFNPTNLKYTVVFKDYNGNIISSATYNFGEEVAIPEAPARDADNTYTYAFTGWDKTVTHCAGDAVYTAVYDATYIEYGIKFIDWNGEVIQTVKYHYGDTITAIADPVRESDETYTYTFLSWNKALGTCTGNASFTAQYESTYINYMVVFKDYDGSVISRKNYHFGDSIVIPENPARASDDVYSYTFKNWGNVSAFCNGNKEYTAVYDAEYVDYTIIFNDYNGSLIIAEIYHFGDNVKAPANPTRAADGIYAYTFAGWDKKIVACDGNATYIATYTATKIQDTSTPGAGSASDTDVNNPSDSNTNDASTGLSGGAVASIAIGSTVAVGAGGFSLFWFVIKKKKWCDLVRVFKR